MTVLETNVSCGVRITGSRLILHISFHSPMLHLCISISALMATDVHVVNRSLFNTMEWNFYSHTHCYI